MKTGPAKDDSTVTTTLGGAVTLNEVLVALILSGEVRGGGGGEAVKGSTATSVSFVP